MATVLPFAALRPSRELAAKVAAPPYDVLSSEEARALAAGNPYSFLHINRPEVDLPPAIDSYDPAVYEKGRENLQGFRNEGVIRQDPAPCYYVYQQSMGAHVQTGLTALVAVAEYEAGRIRKHENTRPAKENDRVRHIEALQAQVGPVFLTYRSMPAVEARIAAGTSAAPEYDFRDDDGVRHVFWLVDDAGAMADIKQAFADVPALYIADGHHRSAAAARIAQKRRAANPHHQSSESCNYFLAVLFPHHQLQVLAYNRAVKDLHGMEAQEFLRRLEEVVTVSASEQPCAPSSEGEFGMYLQGQWHTLKIRPQLLDSKDPVNSLDVSFLQERVLAPLLGITAPARDARIEFIGGSKGLEALQHGVDAGSWAVAFACHPLPLEKLLDVADSGRMMPPKSTWFEPKLKTGLAVHMLD